MVVQSYFAWKIGVLTGSKTIGVIIAVLSALQMCMS